MSRLRHLQWCEEKSTLSQPGSRADEAHIIINYRHIWIVFKQTATQFAAVWGGHLLLPASLENQYFRPAALFFFHDLHSSKHSLRLGHKLISSLPSKMSALQSDCSSLLKVNNTWEFPFDKIKNKSNNITVAVDNLPWHPVLFVCWGFGKWCSEK